MDSADPVGYLRNVFDGTGVRKETVVFQSLSKLIKQKQYEKDFSLLEDLWKLFVDVIKSEKFDGIELELQKDYILKLIFTEYEKGSEGSRRACFDFAKTLDAKFDALFRPSFQLMFGGRKSPSFGTVIQADDLSVEYLVPLIRIGTRSAQAFAECGNRGDKTLFGHNGEFFLPLISKGPPVYPLMSAVMFPKLTGAATKKFEKKKRESLNEGIALLQKHYASHPAHISPFFAHVVETSLEMGREMEEVRDFVLKFQRFMGEKEEQSLDHPSMSALVRATKGITLPDWKRSWCSSLVKSARAIALTNSVLASLTALLYVEPGTAFEMVDFGFLEKKVQNDTEESCQMFLCALIEAYQSLRAVPDLYEVLNIPKDGLRNVFTRDGVREASKQALKSCLHVAARALSLVPRDETGAVVVSDILRFGPVGSEAVAAGWRPLKWAKALTRQIQSDHSPSSLRLYRDLVNAVHYRWSPQLLEQCTKEMEWQTLVNPSAESEEGRLCLLQRLRLSRDFPRLWKCPSDADSLCESIIRNQQGEMDWGVLLWAGGLRALRCWIECADEQSLFLFAREAFCRQGADVRSLHLIETVMGLASLERAQKIATLVPFPFLACCKDEGKVIDYFLKLEDLTGLAMFIQAHNGQRVRDIAVKKWLKEKKDLGVKVAVLLNDKKVWKRALKKNYWHYASGYIEANPDHVEEAVKALMKQENWAATEGCWSCWVSVLKRMPLETWKRLRVGSALFSSAWKVRAFDVVFAIHDLLYRLSLEDASKTAARKSLELLIATDVEKTTAHQFFERFVRYEWGYPMMLRAALQRKDGKLAHYVLSLPAELQNSVQLREAVPGLMERIRECTDRVLATKCVEKLIRIAPPYDATQLAFYLQVCIPNANTSPQAIKASMRALESARKVCPKIWFRSAGVVAAIESHCLYAVSHIPENDLKKRKLEQEWTEAARSVGREIGAGGTNLKQRKHYLSYALADWIVRGEAHATQDVRHAVWSEGMNSAMEAVSSNTKDQEMSFKLIKGSSSNKSTYKRYRKKFEQQDQFKGKI